MLACLVLLKTIVYLIDDEIPFYFSKGATPVIFLCVHGAGMSGVSFAAMASEIKHFGSLATFDLPGHFNHRQKGNFSECFGQKQIC